MRYDDYIIGKVSGVTNINPLSLRVQGISSILIFLVPRSLVFWPVSITAILVPMSQRIAIGGFDLYLLRVLVLVCFMRLVSRSEFYLNNFNKIDKAMCLWVLAMMVIFTLRLQTVGAFVNRMGFALNVLGIYFIFRSLVQDLKDIDRLVKLFILISSILAAGMTIEYMTGRNIFAVFGTEITVLIDVNGVKRCRGPFGHPISAGIFGASMVPLFLSLFWQSRQAKRLAVIGLISSTIITVTSASSTSYLAYVAAVIGTCMWPARKYIRQIMWGGVFALIGLHIVMKAPVWALIGRATVFGSSTGYHRYVLIDRFIRNFDEWWLCGTSSTAHWAHESVQTWDVSNLFVRIGVDGGLISLTFFIFVIMNCFWSIGKSLRFWENDVKTQRLIWAMGAALFTHIIAFIGFSYWDQLYVIFYMLLAMISTVSNLAENIACNDEPFPEKKH